MLKFEEQCVITQANFVLDNGERAIALVYKRYLGEPMIVTKGEGEVREFILRSAFHFNIPIVKDTSLVNRLYDGKDTFIPKWSWHEIIDVMKFLKDKDLISFE